MAISIIVHGVTTGQDFSESNPSPYVQNFYNRPKGPSCFIAEIRNVNNVPSSYYTFYVSQNVFNHGNRAGSYFAISVIIDNDICTDLKAIYKALSSAFHNSFVGTILIKQGNGYRYNIGRFADAKSVIDSTTTSLFNHITNTLGNNLVPIDSSFNLSGRLKSYNPVDLTDSDIISVMKHDGGIILSDEFPSAEQQRIIDSERLLRQREAQDAASRQQQLIRNAEEEQRRLRLQHENELKLMRKEKQDAIEAERRTMAERIKDLEKLIAEKESIIRNYNEEYNQLARHISSLNNRLSSVEKEIVNIQTEVKPTINNPVSLANESATKAKRFSDTEHRLPGHKSGFNPLWVLVGAVTMLLLVLLFAFKSCDNDNRSTAVQNGFPVSQEQVKTDTEVTIGKGSGSERYHDLYKPDYEPSLENTGYTNSIDIPENEFDYDYSDKDLWSKTLRIDFDKKENGTSRYKLMGNSTKSANPDPRYKAYFEQIDDDNIAWNISDRSGKILDKGTGRVFNFKTPSDEYSVSFKFDNMVFVRKSGSNSKTDVTIED